MSILVADLKVYDYVCSGLYYMANNNTCNALYSGSIKHYLNQKNWEQESKRLTKSWLDLNERSYNVRYEKKDYRELSDFLTYRSAEKLTGIQLLKYLFCIRYNIEIQTIQRVGESNQDLTVITAQDRADVELLDILIKELKWSIIQQLPEWNSAKYSD